MVPFCGLASTGSSSLVTVDRSIEGVSGLPQTVASSGERPSPNSSWGCPVAIVVSVEQAPPSRIDRYGPFASSVLIRLAPWWVVQASQKR